MCMVINDFHLYFHAGISRKSRSLFLEMDATAAKTVRPVTPNSQPNVAADASKRARDVSKHYQSL